MSSGPAFVYLQTINDTTGETLNKLISPDGLTRSKICNFSEVAAHRLGWGHGSGKKELILESAYFDGPAANKIFKAMIGNDIHNPTPLTIHQMKATSAAEIIAIYRTMHYLKLMPSFHGNDVRDNIVHGIKSGPLGVKAFKMIIEDLDFDRGLTKLAKTHVMWGRAKGGKQVSKEFDQIQQYAMLHEAQYGLWSEMTAIGIDAQQKIKERRDRKAEVQQKAAYDGDFPTLPNKKR